MPQDALRTVSRRHDLAPEVMEKLMMKFMAGTVSPVMMAALLTALRMKPETADEVFTATLVLHQHATQLPLPALPHLVDTCGTGGDGKQTFNISTAASFVAAACGAQVAKHCGRVVSSSSGSGDVIEALGIPLEKDPARLSACIVKTGLGLIFAPHFHAATRHVAPVRKELTIRTLFNILGPLTNPTRSPHQLVGVWSEELVQLVVQVLAKLGRRHAMVVHGMDGMDEISACGPTLVAELNNGEIKKYTVQPENFGLPVHSIDDMVVSTVAESQGMILAALEGKLPPARDAIAINAGAAIYVSGVEKSLSRGVQRALEALANGQALKKLLEVRSFFND